MNLTNESLIPERGMNMKRTHLLAVLVGIVAMGIFAADASAMYHPGMGTFMQRDPGAGGAHRLGAGGAAAATGRFIPRDPTGSRQYADGMNLYQYVRSSPTGWVDPSGLVGEDCRYTGNSDVATEAKKLKLSTGIVEHILDPTIVNRIVYTCKCEINCCDYDWHIVWRTLYMDTPAGRIAIGSAPYEGGWYRDPDDDYTKWKDMESYEDFASHSDMITDYKFAGQALGGMIYSTLSEWSRTKSEQEIAEMTGLPGIEDWVGGKVGEMLLLDILKKNGVIKPEDVWDAENKAKVQQFTDKCKGICQGKKGQKG